MNDDLLENTSVGNHLSQLGKPVYVGGTSIRVLPLCSWKQISTLEIARFPYHHSRQEDCVRPTALVYPSVMLARTPSRNLSKGFRAFPLQSLRIALRLPVQPPARVVVGQANGRAGLRPFSTDNESVLGENEEPAGTRKEHAVISAFDLFSVGVGPSS